MPVDFKKFVEQRVESAAALNREEKLAAWKGELDKLYADMEGYLKPYIGSGIRIERRPVETTEDELGSYTVDALVIFIGNAEVIVEPLGTLVIGARGGVDLSGFHGRRRIVLLEKGGPVQTITIRGANGLEEESTRSPLRNDISHRGWYLVTSPPNLTATPLDADSFQRAIMYVAGAYGD